MKNFKFSKHPSLFFDFVQLKIYNNNLIVKVPIIIYKPKTDFLPYSENNEILFETHYKFGLKDFNELKKYEEIKSWEVKKFFDTEDINFYNKLVFKYDAWISHEILKPTPTKCKEYSEYEFIQVDDETSFYGNFEQDGIEGCYLSFGKKPYNELTLDIRPYFSEYFKKEKLNFSDKSNGKILEELNKYGLKFSIEYLKNTYTEDNFFFERFYPFYVRLNGNDDDSWTKYFCTEEEMIQEVYRLRRSQPINKDIDVIGNNYMFTN